MFTNMSDADKEELALSLRKGRERELEQFRLRLEQDMIGKVITGGVCPYCQAADCRVITCGGCNANKVSACIAKHYNGGCSYCFMNDKKKAKVIKFTTQSTPQPTTL